MGQFGCTANVQYTEIYRKMEILYVQKFLPTKRQLNFRCVSEVLSEKWVTFSKTISSDFIDLCLEPAYTKFEAAGMLQSVGRARYAREVWSWPVRYRWG